MSNDYRMVDTDFFSNFPSSCKRISFNDGLQFITVNFQWLITTLLVFNALGSFAKLLEPLLHCMFTSSFWTKCIIDVTSCLYWRRKWQPAPVFLPGESWGQGSLVGGPSMGSQSWTWLKHLSSSSSSCLYCFTTHYELEFKKIAQICFLSTISVV